MSGELKQALVLAHGVGENCFPFGGEKSPRPKYAFEVGNVPLVQRVVDQVLALGMERVWVVAGFQAHVIQEIVNQSYSGRPVEVIAVKDYRSGDAAAALSAVWKARIRGNLLIVNGDLLAFEADYRGLINAFAERGGSMPVALYDELPDEEDKPSWHTLEATSDGRAIARIRGRVEDGKYRLTGMYAIDGGTLAMAADFSPSPGQRIYLPGALAQAIGAGLTVGAVRAQDEVVHVDRCFDYLDANHTVLKREARAIPGRAGAGRQGAYVYRGEGEPDPEFIFPGTIISPGATVVCEEDAFIGPYETREQHRAALKREHSPVMPIRIRGDVYLGKGSRVGLGALIEGNLVVGENSYIEDSVVERGVLIGDGVGVRRHAVVRSLSVCADRSRFECAADFEGVAGPGTIYMHPGQCFIVTGRKCDLGAGNFFGTWRFDSGRSRYKIGGRLVTPGREGVANASYIGDEVRTAVGVIFMPGTRVGADSLLGAGLVAHGTYEAGYFYAPKQEIIKRPVTGIRPHKGRAD
jgi:NDP-sugar pyrophosphorylase family protein